MHGLFKDHQIKIGGGDDGPAVHWVGYSSERGARSAVFYGPPGAPAGTGGIVNLIHGILSPLPGFQQWVADASGNEDVLKWTRFPFNFKAGIGPAQTLHILELLGAYVDEHRGGRFFAAPRAGNQ